MVNLKLLVNVFLLICSTSFLIGQEVFTITLPLTQDATIFSENSQGANGQGNLFVGRTNQSNLRRALLRFDVSDIPHDANILTASLQVVGSKESTDHVSIHRVTSTWSEGSSGAGSSGGTPFDASEGDATWSHGVYDSNSWNTSGGDYISIASAFAGVSENTVNVWRGEEMIWDIYGWLLGNLPNYGWIMVGDETQDKSAVRLTSGESQTNHPVLVVTYTLPPDGCDANGGSLSGGPFTFCVGDGGADKIALGQVVLSNSIGSKSQWVVTDIHRNILGLPTSYTEVDFDGAGTGTCLLWHLSYEDGLVGATMGANANDLQGCYDLSNPIAVNRIDDEAICSGLLCDIQGALLTGGPFNFCVGDGSPDQLGGDAIGVFNSSELSYRWVVTDLNRNILGLPGHFTDVDFDGAGIGTCQIWYIQHDGEIAGLTMGQNLSNVQGCYGISNPVTVQRKNDPATCNPCQLTSALLTGGPFEFCVGDGLSDVISNGEIGLYNHTVQGRYVVTDISRNILGLPGFYTDVDFEGAGIGTCLIYYVQFENGVRGFDMGASLNDLTGCYSLSNPVTVIRSDDDRFCSRGNGCDVSGGILAGGPYTFCVGDGQPDRLSSNAVELFNNTGGSQRWVITDISNVILGLPVNFTDVDFEGAGVGTCLIYNLQYDGEISGLVEGQNLNNILGCSSRSNPVAINRTNATETCGTGGGSTCSASGGILTGGPFTFCVGDGTADHIPSNEVSLFENVGMNRRWVVTDISNNILGLPGDFTEVNFDGAGEGTCLLYSVSYDDGVTGFTMGANLDNLEGCSSLSNAVAIVRSSDSDACSGDTGGGETCDVRGGSLVGGPFSFCVGDGASDIIGNSALTLSSNSGANNIWVLTDLNKHVVATSASLEDLDYDSYSVGTYLLWNVTADSQEALDELETGSSIEASTGCTESSNPVQITLHNDCNVVSENECQMPTNIQAKMISPTTFKITWDRVSGFYKHYLIEFGFKDEPGSYVSVTSKNNQIKISASWSKVVMLRIRTMCTWTSSSDWSEYIELGTKGGGPKSLGQDYSLFGTQLGAFTIVEDQLSVLPNPAGDFVDVSFISGSEDNSVEIINIQGQSIRKYKRTNGIRKRIDISDIPSGMYMMMLKTEGNVIEQKRFIKTE